MPIQQANKVERILLSNSSAEDLICVVAGENQVLRDIEARIAKVTHLPVEHGEGMQVRVGKGFAGYCSVMVYTHDVASPRSRTCR